MCCLFGMLDSQNKLTVKQKNHIIRALSLSAEERGMDAVGISYNSGQRLRVIKYPGPARKHRFLIPANATVVMGHTRLATQGNAKYNRNNHPFLGKTKSCQFALAHNGVIWNDEIIKYKFKLPKTKIETDSYVAVQIIESKQALNFQSLQYMAEELEGSFTFTILDEYNSLYIVKADSPFCLIYYSEIGLYLYASTSEILMNALTQINFIPKIYQKISVDYGDILQIDKTGTISRSNFNPDKIIVSPNLQWQDMLDSESNCRINSRIESLIIAAEMFGYNREDIVYLLSNGYSFEELMDSFDIGEI